MICVALACLSLLLFLFPLQQQPQYQLHDLSSLRPPLLLLLLSLVLVQVYPGPLVLLAVFLRLGLEKTLWLPHGHGLMLPLVPLVRLVL